MACCTLNNISILRSNEFDAEVIHDDDVNDDNCGIVNQAARGVQPDPQFMDQNSTRRQIKHF